MKKTCTYRVGGHLFEVTLPDIPKLWGAIEHQYLPFIVDNSTEGERVFSVELVEELPQGERVCIYDMPTADGETVVKMYRQGSDWLFEIAQDHRLPICARILANEDFTKASLHLENRLIRDAIFGINNATMLIYAFATASRNTLEMHASVILNEGKAYLFLGKSGTGKSTHSSLWLKHIAGSELMNDDNPVVRIWPDGRIIAYGSPWSGKTPCYKNIEAPIGAYVQIRQCPENKISRMGVLDAFSSMFSSVSGIKDDDSVIADGINESINQVLTNIPFYLLDCRPDEEAAVLCSSTVRK